MHETQTLQFVEVGQKINFEVIWTCDMEYCENAIEKHVSRRKNILAFRGDIALADAEKNYTAPICSKCKHKTSPKIK